MLIHLPIIILTSLHPTPNAVPKFDIARECQFEASSKDDLDRCVTDETQAREKLQTEWAQFTPSAKPSATRKTTWTAFPVMSNCRSVSKWREM